MKNVNWNIFMRIWYVCKHVLHIFHISAFSCQYWNDTITFGIYFHLLVLNIYCEYQNNGQFLFQCFIGPIFVLSLLGYSERRTRLPNQNQGGGKIKIYFRFSVRYFIWLLQLGCKYGYTKNSCGCCDVSINIHCSTALQADAHLSACIKYNCNDISTYHYK